MESSPRPRISISLHLVLVSYDGSICKFFLLFQPGFSPGTDIIPCRCNSFVRIREKHEGMLKNHEFPNDLPLV